MSCSRRHSDLLYRPCYIDIPGCFVLFLHLFFAQLQSLRQHLVQFQRCCLKCGQYCRWRCCSGLDSSHALIVSFSNTSISSFGPPFVHFFYLYFFFLIRAFSTYLDCIPLSCKRKTSGATLDVLRFHRSSTYTHFTIYQYRTPSFLPRDFACNSNIAYIYFALDLISCLSFGSPRPG